MSISFLLPPSSRTANAVVWRGLMVQKATQQLLFDVDWSPGLDVLVVDLPPGTGDVQLTLAQLVKVDGVVIVSTPQAVALADVKKGVDMFRKTGVPVRPPILVFHLHLYFPPFSGIILTLLSPCEDPRRTPQHVPLHLRHMYDITSPLRFDQRIPHHCERDGTARIGRGTACTAH